MQIEERLQVLKQVEKVAALAGLRGQIDENGNHYMMSFQTAESRTQLVYVRVSGKNPEGKDIITLFSPARTVAKGFFSGLSKDDALDLLRRNEQLFFARFGIWETDKQSMVVASADLLLETLDPDELKTHSFYVAFAADGYEATHGGDQF